MKKRILLFLSVLVLMALGYYFYTYYNDEYHPEALREQYSQNAPIAFTDRALPKKKFVPRKQFHEQADYKRSDDQVVALNGLGPDSGVFSELSSTIEELKKSNSDCEVTFNEYLPPAQIIDPDSSFYAQDESIVNLVNRSLDLLMNLEGRAIAKRFPQYAQEALDSVDEISEEDMAAIMRAPLVCRQSNITVLFETIIEMSSEGKLTDAQRAEIVDSAVNKLVVSLEADSLQDNILMSLTLLKAVGSLSSKNQEYFSELEAIYDEMSTSQAGFDQASAKNAKVVNPGEVYRNYRERQRGFSSSVVEILYFNYPEFLNE
ncbi:hypothetical protein [Halobacteriovorax sp. RZ-2]|uniref:hypothetical protein n=1 Tax=unclassified Halobacteriovorax TaxID=2639665 RepID=UPI00371C1F7A